MTTTNMLEQMASGMIEEKATKGRGLTPLVSELPARLTTPASFPNDLPEDAIRGIIVDLVRQHTALGEVIDALSLRIGLDSTPGPVPLTENIKQKEREADARVAAKIADSTVEGGEDPVDVTTMNPATDDYPATEGQAQFEADLAAKTEAAQAATFKPDPSGWQCPNGHDTIEEKTSPRGRQFARCTTCGEFQK